MTVKDKKLICDCCNKNVALGVVCVPMVACSMAYCKECLHANSHPMNVLIANTVCIDGLEHANEYWKRMVTDSLKYQGKTLEWFNEEVSKASESAAGQVQFTSEPIFINPRFNSEWAKSHRYQHSPGYPEHDHTCICGKHEADKIHIGYQIPGG